MEELILKHEKLIYSIINKYRNFYDVEDLKQVAVIGLIKAFNNYKSNLNTKFSTYAYKYILGEVLKFVNDNRSFRLSKEYLQLENRVSKAREILTQKLMRDVSNYELAMFLEVDVKLIDQLDLLTSKIDSLDKVIMEDGKSLTLLDTITSNKDYHNIDNIYLYEELSKLDDSEKRLVKNRYFLDKTQLETASDLGINQVQVSRVEKKILKKLKANMLR